MVTYLYCDRCGSGRGMPCRRLSKTRNGPPGQFISYVHPSRSRLHVCRACNVEMVETYAWYHTCEDYRQAEYKMECPECDTLKISSLSQSFDPNEYVWGWSQG